jgi:hypothetical protein
MEWKRGVHPPHYPMLRFRRSNGGDVKNGEMAKHCRIDDPLEHKNPEKMTTVRQAKVIP